MSNQLKEAAEAVHEELGSGFSESIYHRALERELSEQGVAFHSEGTIPVMYKGAPVGRRRPDLFIVADDGTVTIVELKAGSTSGEAQLDQYLDIVDADSNFGKIAGGALIQFNSSLEFEEFEREQE